MNRGLPNAAPRNGPAEAFFLPSAVGKRFCLYHPATGAARGAFIYVHPFAEEMNKCRRMAALQSRALAQAGYGVLQIDLLGCGDSSGDFGDARWEAWIDDLNRAWQWLAQKLAGPIGWWGMRIGALLALEAARQHGAKHPERRGPVLLWQPVISGEVFMTQFLRMRVASDMLGNGAATSATSAADGSPVKPTGTQAMRAAMAAGESLEVGGYELAPALVAAIDSLRLAKLGLNGVPVHWFEVVADAERALPPAAATAEAALRAAGVELHLHRAVGPAFWTSQEVVDCPGLLTATTAFDAMATA